MGDITETSRERSVTLTLPHSQMCSLLGALNWARNSLRHMPAGLRVPVDTLDELDDIYKAFQPAFDRAALSVPTDPRSVTSMRCECENPARRWYTGRDKQEHCEQCDGLR